MNASAVLALTATLVLGLAAHVRAETYAYPSKGRHATPRWDREWRP